MDSPLSLIEEKLQEFQEQLPEIRKQRYEIAELKKIAIKKGNHVKLDQLQDLMFENQQALEDWYSAKEKIQYTIDLVNKVPGVDWNPLGIAPVVIGVTAVAATAALTAMTLVVNKTVQMRMQLRGIREGWLTPQEAEKVAKASGAGLGLTLGGMGLGTLLAVGGGLWLLSRK